MCFRSTEYDLGSAPNTVIGFRTPPRKGGGPKYYLYTIKIFFMKLPKQPKERFPNIYFTFADPETRFFDLKKYFVNLVSV